MAFVDRNGVYGLWDFTRLDKQIWLVKYAVTANNIFTLTGADPDSILFLIPAPFRLIRFEAYFNDITSKNLVLKHITPDKDKTGFTRLLNLQSDVSREIIAKYGEGYEFEDGMLKIEITGTINKTVIFLFYLQRL